VSVIGWDGRLRLPLGTWPTPVRRLAAASRRTGVEVWAKLEEECGTWGGNKVRKLEYLLAHARERAVESLTASGVGSSSWAAAVALHGARQGFDVAVFLSGAVPSDYAPLYERARVVLLPGVRSAPLAPVAAWGRAAIESRTIALPPGGSGGLGDIGSAHAGLELAARVAQGGLPRPAAVFCAAGTGGTAAGLAVGMGAGGLDAPVHAVRVTPLPLGSGPLLRRRVRRLAARLDVASPAPVIARAGFHAPGYGRASPAVEKARVLATEDGVSLDVTYAGKAFAALIESALRGHPGPLVLLATSPGPPPATT
jgi:D-cysteine desulfhydrase